MKMVTKALLCVFLVYGVVQCRPSIDLEKISADCSKQTHMSSETLKNILKTEQMPEKSQTYFNFLECLYKQQNYFDEKGLVDYAAIEKYLVKFHDSSQLRKAIQPCENVQVGTSMGERAYNAGKCIIDSLHTLENEENSSMEPSEEKNII